ncbi:MAG: hypothetical protein H6Q87_1782 [candidate division NC10 bacterium]|nr:hypothetical protein [candidate division NC10 bacterium]
MNRVCVRAARSFGVLAIAAWLVAVPAVALAQSGGSAPAKPVSGLGYGFFGVGAATWEGESEGTWHVGGGGEALFRDAFGVGAEMGYLSWLEEGSDGLGVLSVNGSYHFNGGTSARRWRPFLTGGYTLGFDGEMSENLFNVGGGVDVWMKPRVGLRLEFRDHIWSEEGDTIHFWGFRIGVTFR